MYSKQELIKKCWKGKYFKNNMDADIMYATTDGNFFYEESYATGRARSNKSEVITITRNDINRISRFWRLRVNSSQSFRWVVSFLSFRNTITKTKKLIKSNKDIIITVISLLMLLLAFLSYIK